MNVPGLGEVVKDESLDWLYSQRMHLTLLGGEGRVVLEGYAGDPRPEDFHAAIARLLAATPAALKAAEGAIFAYYRKVNSYWQPGDEDYLEIASPADVWQHIELGAEPTVSRGPDADQAIYVSLECSCDWEREHGLQIVLRHGDTVCKVGPYDGHFTHSDPHVLYPER